MLLNFIIVIALIVLNIPLYKLIFKLFFEDSEDFSESVKYSFTPDLISLFRGEYWKDQMGQAKLSFFILSCIFAVGLEFLIVKFIINLFI